MRTLILFFVLLPLGAGQVSAQMTFEENVIRSSFDGAIAVSLGDIDGDGDLDVVGAASEDGEIFWYEYEKGKLINEHVVGERAWGVSSVALGDMNGDGNIDIILGVRSSVVANLLWYENTNKGKSFVKHVVSKEPLGIVTSVAVGDLDGDKDLDILYTSFNNDKVAWYTNEGVNSGNFENEHVISTEIDYATSVNTGDFNGDGFLDVVCTGRGRNGSVTEKSIVAWFPNDGAGNFSVKQNIAREDSTCPEYVEVGDMDGDGDLDLVVTFYAIGTVRWYVNGGTGNFTSSTIFSGLEEESFRGGVSFVSVGDLDRDGDLDIATVAWYSSRLTWYKNDGVYGFHRGIISNDISSGECVRMGDIDGDGDMDIFTASSGDDKLRLFHNVSLKANLSGISEGTLVNEPFTVRLNLNMKIKGLTLDDIEVVNGTVTKLERDIWDNDDYLIEITPEKDGEVIIKIPQGSFSAIAKNEENEALDLSVIYDTIGPVVVSVDVPFPNIYMLEEELLFTVHFNEPIVFDGDAELILDYSTPDNILGKWNASLISSDEKSLTFKHAVKQGDEDLDGLVLALNSLLLADKDTIFDRINNPAILTLNRIGDLSAVWVDARAHTPTITNAETDEDTPTSSGLEVKRHQWDGEEVKYFQVSNISNGKLYQQGGVTEILEGDFVAYDIIARGLVFQPNENYYGTGSFDVQSSLTDDINGLGGEQVTAIITIHSVNDTPVIEQVEDIVRVYGKEEQFVLDLSLYCYDVEQNADSLIYRVTSSNENTAVAFVDEGALKLDFYHVGETTLLLIAEDENGAKATVSFKVNIAPALLRIRPKDKRCEVNLVDLSFEVLLDSLKYQDKVSVGYYTTATLDSEVGEYDIEITDVSFLVGDSSDYIIEQETGILEIYSINRLFIPNLFTPNGDGNNDVFRIRSLEIAAIRLKIYDISGKLLFQTDSREVAVGIGWDGTYGGKQMPAGNYIWEMDGTFFDGSQLSFGGERVGVFTLLR